MLSRALEIATTVVSSATGQLNKKLKEHSPTTIIVGTLAAYYLINKTYDYSTNTIQFLRRNWPSPFFNKKQMQKSAAQLFHSTKILGPIIKKEADKEFNKLANEIQKDVDKHRKELGPVFEKIPEQGKTKDFILSMISHATKEYEKKLKGRVSGMVYVKENKEYSDLIDETYSRTKLTNPMHDAEFPLIDKMAAEVLAMCQSLFNGDVKAFQSKEEKKLPGLVTDGGTSSIMEAISAYVLYAKSKGIKQPEIIVPSTAHVSFKNAAKRFGATYIEVPVDPKTNKANVGAMEKAITKNTCLIVGSAPSFPSGVFDPIQGLGAIGLKHNIPLHVDACFGGFLNPFAKRAGFYVPDYDFSVPGVMSISADPHKYGQTPKGSSVLLFHPNNPASSEAIFTDLDWTGGMYVAQGMKGSRSGHAIGTTWSAFLYHGMDGYTQAAENILKFTHQLSHAIANVKGIRLLYPTELSVISISTIDSDVNPYLVASELKKRHWNLNLIQNPPGIHFCITATHTDHQNMILKEFIHDLSDALVYAENHLFEKPSGTAGVYGMLDEVPDFMANRIGNMYASIHNSLSSELLAGEFIENNRPEDVEENIRQRFVL